MFVSHGLHRLLVLYGEGANARVAEVTYAFTNRTPEKKLNRAAYHWLQNQVESRISVARQAEK